MNQETSTITVIFRGDGEEDFTNVVASKITEGVLVMEFEGNNPKTSFIPLDRIAYVEVVND